MAFDQGHALLIGVGEYPNLSPEWSAPQTVEDALEVMSVLTNSRYAGYPEAQVTVLSNETATRQNVLDALDALANVAVDHTVLIFYNGHGFLDENGLYCLTTREATLAIGNTVNVGSGVTEKELLEKLEQIKAKRTILLFNACLSGNLSPTLDSLGEASDQEAPSLPLPNETANALLATGEGRIIITACREDQNSWFAPTEELTFFGDALASTLQGRGVESRKGYISAFDLYEQLYQSVHHRIKQASEGRIQQDPELTILKGVGPMAVALHRGKEGLGNLGPEDTPHTLPEGVREIEPSESQAHLQQILSGEIRHSVVAGRDANPVTVDNSSVVIVQTSGGTVDQQTGDRIDTGGGAFFGEVTMRNHGTVVAGDKVGGDKITTGPISGSSGIAIGSGASASVAYGMGGQEVAAVTQLFQPIYSRIDQLPQPPIVQQMVKTQILAVEEEARKGEQANEQKVEDAFALIKSVAPDILEVAVVALANPVAGVSKVVQKVAERMREVR